MLSQMQTQARVHSAIDEQQHSTSSGEPAVLENNQVAPQSRSQYLGSAFWTSLKGALDEIELELHTDVTDADTDLADEVHTPTDTSSSSGPPLIDPIVGGLVPSVLLLHPPTLLVYEFCSIYFRNVDPVFKVLHGPSVCGHMQQGLPYLDYEDGSNSVVALKFVLYFAAVATISDVQCRALLGVSSVEAVAQYRSMAEAALARADYLVSNDFLTLQCLVIYLAMCRHTDITRRTWTLVSVAVRSALALEIHTEKTTRNVFATEQHRRLWHALCVLDLNLAVDLASDALILPGTYDTPRPSNINDSDISPYTIEPVSPRTGWTDSTCSLMFQHIADGARIGHASITESWKQRRDYIVELRKTIEDEYISYCDPTVPLHAFTIALGRSTGAALLLHSIRPTKASSCDVKVPFDAAYLLPFAIDALSNAQAIVNDPTMAGWSWAPWIHWHSIAVAFAALALIPEGELADRGWSVTEVAFFQFSAAALGHRAQLRRPLERLAVRARRAKGASSLGHVYDTSNNPMFQSYPLATASQPKDLPLLSEIELPSSEEWDMFLQDYTASLDVGSQP
ncbi:hypothetical protein LTS14_009455 [Recurvomyces mirabilis]|uniref:uncharacterized protein n=1 Tax=Recurvomyces mirabilis TaxID=574656 RepID=UPI002DE0F76F|nr:hypothetical protein LTS14_009455 [Recurvomyces mirabilis]